MLTKPKIAVHHGILKELLKAISRHSTETHDEGSEKWFFPSAVRETSLIEWMTRQILVHLDFFPTPCTLYEEIAEFHALKLGITLSKAKILKFFADGVDQREWPLTLRIRNVSSWNSLAEWIL